MQPAVTTSAYEVPWGPLSAAIEGPAEVRDRYRALCRGDESSVYRVYFPICALVALQMQAGLDGFLAIEKYILVKRGLFTVEERVSMLQEVTSDLPNVSVDTFRGLLVEFCRSHGVSAIVKGLRAVSDFEYEMEMAQMNYRLAQIETLFLTANPLYSFLRASRVREIAAYGGAVRSLVPGPVDARLVAKLAAR